MARYPVQKDPPPVAIDKFYGINESVGENELKTGEWSKGYNARVTKNYELQKRPGHHTFINFGVGPVRGIWYGRIGGVNYMIVAHGGRVYRYNMDMSTTTINIADLITEGVVVEIGTMTDADTFMIWFKGQLILMNGSQWKTYDGTTFQEIVPYVPTIAIGTPPDGGGTSFEEINELTGQKKQKFLANNTDTEYILRESNLQSVDTVWVNDVIVTDYTTNLSDGKVIFNSARQTDDEVIVMWTKNNTNPAVIKAHTHAVAYGYINDTNLFIFGNDNEKNVFRYSYNDDPSYFPVNSNTIVTTDEYAITDMKEQYKRLIVFKEREARIVTPTPNPAYENNKALNEYIYGSEGLNKSVGNIAKGMVQVVENNPVSLDGFSIRMWYSETSVEDERNARVKSDRLKPSLERLDLSEAITFDYQNKKEYWMNIDGIVYVWNYGNDTMYKYDNFRAKRFIEIKGKPYYISDHGTVEDVDEDYLADGQSLGTNINIKIYGGYSDFGQLQLRKMTRDQWFALAPAARTGLRIKFISNERNESQQKWKTISFSWMSFNNVDFNKLTFNTSRQPQANRIRYKLKKFAYIQWIIENNTNNESLTLIKILIMAQTQGFSS